MAETMDQFQAIPAELRERKQWLVWRFEQADSDKKPRKVPYYVSGRRRGGDQGSDRDRAALVSLDAAVRAFHGLRPPIAEGVRAELGMSGIGIAFLPGDGLVGIDLDNALDPETGEVADVALEIVAACASWTETTPSGRGLHIYLTHAQLDKEAGKALTGRANDIGGGVGLEMYSGRQFFTVTGRTFGEPLPVAELHDELGERIKATIERAKKAGRVPAQPARGPIEVSDQEERRLIESALACLSADLAYNDWVAVGMAIYDKLGEGALGVWDYWSSRGASYPGSDDLRRKWASFAGRPPGTAGVIFTLAKQAGWVRPRKPRPPGAGTTVAEPSRQEEASASIPELPPDLPSPPLDDGYMQSMTDMADWISQFRRTDKGKITPTLHNALLVMENDPRWRDKIAFDEFAYRITKRPPPGVDGKTTEWTDTDDVMMMVYLTREYGFEPKKTTVMDAVLAQANANRYNPLRDYLDGLVWDGTPRVRKALITYWGALSTPDTASLDGEERARLRVYLQCASQKWFVGAIARALNPGCKLDTMLVFESGQGARKSSSLRALFGDPFFADSKLNLADKDALSQMQGKWAYEMGEMDAFNKAEDTLFKQFMSSQVDRVRWHYGKRAEDVPRSSIFIGTTNQGQYGKDPTGMRRVWPFTTGTIDIEAIKRDRDQLWAEAMHLWREKARWWVDRDVIVIRADQEEFGGAEWSEWDLFKEQADRRQIVDAWAEPILAYIDDHPYSDFFTTAELMEHALVLDKARWSKAEQMRVAAVMTQLGYLNRKRGKKDRRFNAWVPPEKDVAPTVEVEEIDDVPL